MGSGNLLKTIIKKVKDDSSKQVKGSSASKKSNGLKWKKHQRKASIKTSFTSGNSNTLGMPIEDLAATQIQTAFRAYRARKHLRRLKGMAQIRARRLCMVTEGRLREKKIANQLKLEAKLHDIEYKLRACRNLSERRFDVLTSVGMVIWRVEWSGGPETLEEVLTKIQQREEAAVKRERTMAYAFSHQWRAPNSNNNGLGNYELAKANWGWSWVERWIAVRPWESRLPTQSITPKKAKNRQISKAGKNSNSPKPKASVSVKPPLSNGKGTMKPRRLSYPGAEKPAVRKESTKTEEVNIQKEEIAT
ncbi:protein IQ-DOMAIN 1-like isoform X3 [Durio zibethinus]|uniref:Protein IQ-DOMAIN 1-like isoform X3 n=1 Tax=Durio zibethinus TaxID=66656 RepID=A0A6P5WIK6_DURZI|nr:protein IQ-DOMAIN 1-like isoform X3 [Durio zibethinus]